MTTMIILYILGIIGIIGVITGTILGFSGNFKCEEIALKILPISGAFCGVISVLILMFRSLN